MFQLFEIHDNFPTKSISSSVLSIDLTLQEGASGMDIKKGGGLLMPAPIKTHLKALLARFFCIGRVGG